MYPDEKLLIEDIRS